MKLRVAIPLIAAICLVGSPAMASSPEEQMVKGRGARDRSAGGNSAGGGGGERRGGTTAAAPRSGGERSGGERTASEGRRRADNDPRADGRDEGQRVAVRRRDRDRGRDNPPIVVRQSRPSVNVNIGSFGPRYYSPYHYDRWVRSYYRWSPIGYAPWSLIYGSIGFSNFGIYGAFPPSTYHYGYNGYYGPGTYSPWQPSGYDIGGVRLKIRPREAQVFVDGYYAGLVDDFDGTFQSLRLEQGGHKIEIHLPGYEDLELDVHVQAGRTLTLAEVMRPRP